MTTEYQRKFQVMAKRTEELYFENVKLEEKKNSMEESFGAYHSNMVSNVKIVMDKVDEAIKEQILIHKEFYRRHKHDINKVANE